MYNNIFKRDTETSCDLKLRVGAEGKLYKTIGWKAVANLGNESTLKIGLYKKFK